MICLSRKGCLRKYLSWDDMTVWAIIVTVLPIYITDYSRQRLTGGVTLSFGKAFQADLRINYEKYFYDDLSLAKESEQDKFVMELMVRF